MTLNWRHKAGLFLTLIAVGCGFFLELSVKQTVGIALLGIAFAWLIGSLTLRTLMVTFAILICAVGGYVAGTPIWGDWNSVRNSAAQYDFAIADLRAAVKGALAIVSSVPIPPGVTIGAPVSPGDPIPPDAIIGAPRQGAKPKKQGQSTLDDIDRTRTVTIPDSAKIWMRSEVLPPLPKGYTLAKPSQPVIWETQIFPATMSDADVMKAFRTDQLQPRPKFSLGSSVRAHTWNVIGGLALFISGLSVLGWSFRGSSRASDRES